MVGYQYVNNYTKISEGEEWVFEIILNKKTKINFIFIICVDVSESLCVCAHVCLGVHGS